MKKFLLIALCINIASIIIASDIEQHATDELILTIPYLRIPIIDHENNSEHVIRFSVNLFNNAENTDIAVIPIYNNGALVTKESHIELAQQVVTNYKNQLQQKHQERYDQLLQAQRVTESADI